MSKRPKRMHEVERMTQEERTVVERQEDGQPEGESVVRGRPGRRANASSSGRSRSCGML
jgi:hypothetical protein